MSTTNQFVAVVPEMRKFRIAGYLADYLPVVYAMLLLLTGGLNSVLSIEMYFGLLIGSGLVLLTAVYLALKTKRDLKPVIASKFAEQFTEHTGRSFPDNFLPIVNTPHIFPMTAPDGTEERWAVTKHADGFTVHH